MINEKMEKAFNEQINKEFYSANIYLSMAAYLESIGLKGFSNWMRVQFQEEQAHAMLMFDYVLSRGGKIELMAVDKPQTTWNGVLDVFEATLEHEKYVTSLINNLADIADEIKDRPSASFLKWFIDEQVEEESNAEEIISKLKLINSEGNALFMMDAEFMTRTFVQPVIN